MLRHQLSSLMDRNLENQTLTAESEVYSRWGENIYVQEGSRNSNLMQVYLHICSFQYVLYVLKD